MCVTAALSDVTWLMCVFEGGGVCHGRIKYIKGRCISERPGFTTRTKLFGTLQYSIHFNIMYTLVFLTFYYSIPVSIPYTSIVCTLQYSGNIPFVHTLYSAAVLHRDHV